MKAYRWVVLGSLGCLVIVVVAYFWATGLQDSLYAFRSPLHANPPTPGQPLGDALSDRVVFVLIDALRDDTSHDAKVMPFLNELRGRGAWATVHSRTPSYSDPGWSVLMTGAWPDVSDGPALNTPDDETPTWTQDNLFTAAHRNGLKTAVSGKDWFSYLIPQADVDAHFYVQGEDQVADRAVVDAALAWLRQGEHRFVLIHIDQVDYAGHSEGGPRDPHWAAAALRADGLLREIVAALDVRRDTLLVVSDHGQIDQGGHGGQDAITLVEPFVLVGAGVRPGQYADIQQVDVAPTVATLLGLNIPATAQGVVQQQMLLLAADQQARVAAALLAQKVQLANDYVKSIGGIANFQPTSVAELLQAMDAAKAERLMRERVPRFGVALLLAAIPVVVLLRRRGRLVAWCLGGALVYVVVFNVRYAFLDGRTYSLSSVTSADDLVAYVAITAAAALVVAWLATALVLGSFRVSPREAAERCFAQVFLVLFVLVLPVLWSFALNGVLVTWTLPDLASSFLGFLCLLQCLFVAAVGLVLAGVSALFATFVPGRR